MPPEVSFCAPAPDDDPDTAPSAGHDRDGDAERPVRELEHTRRPRPWPTESQSRPTGHPAPEPRHDPDDPKPKRRGKAQRCTDILDLMAFDDDGCPHDAPAWWQTCSGAEDCVCPECMRDSVLQSLPALSMSLGRRFEDDAVVTGTTEGFLKANQSCDEGTASYMGRGHLRGHLFTVGNNVAADVTRRARRGPLGRASSIQPGFDIPERPAEEAYRANDDDRLDAEMIGKCLPELAEEDRQLLILRFCGEGKMSFAEVGRRMGISPANAARRIKMAAARLADLVCRGRDAQIAAEKFRVGLS